MVIAVVALIILVTVVVALTFLLGFRLGGHSSWAEAQEVRAQAAAAQRELHDLTRYAFVAMAEEVEARGRGGRRSGV